MKLMIVDDSKTDVMIISQLLNEYEVIVAEDGIEAIQLLQQNPDVAIMILDIMMPRMNGFEVLEVISNNSQYSNVATLILTNCDEIENEIRGLELGAVDYIRKPLNMQSVKKRIELHRNLISARKKLEQQNIFLEKAVFERTNECNVTRDVTINAMVGLLEVRNIESSNHTRRTQIMMKMLCDYLCNKKHYKNIMTETYKKDLFSTAPLHDIGKVGIQDSILLKPGKLTDEEFEIMKKHTIYGVNAFKYASEDVGKVSFLNTALEIIGTHHEKYNGLGYPNGIKGEEIPLAGRLMAIIDVYDALVSERVYKSAYTHEEALEIINKERNQHFDGEIVEAFLELESEISSINQRLF